MIKDIIEKNNLSATSLVYSNFSIVKYILKNSLSYNDNFIKDLYKSICYQSDQYFKGVRKFLNYRYDLFFLRMNGGKTLEIVRPNIFRYKKKSIIKTLNNVLLRDSDLYVSEGVSIFFHDFKELNESIKDYGEKYMYSKKTILDELCNLPNHSIIVTKNSIASIILGYELLYNNSSISILDVS